MAKYYSKRNRTRKSLIATLCAVAVTCTGLAAACAPAEEEDNPSKPTREDSQVLKNGNFEYFNVPEDAVYLINGVNDWTLGGSSSVMSGIIGTTTSAWDKLTDSDLKSKLDYNNDISSSDDDYVDYNSMKSSDILYKDTYSALLEDDKIEESKIKLQGAEQYYGITDINESASPITGKFDGETVYKNGDDGQYYFDSDFTKPIRTALISNPGSHYGEFNEDDTKLGDKTLHKDEEGYLYLDEEEKLPVGNVLMIHNYYNDGKYNGLQQYYTSSSITLDQNTSAEISLWVKTSNLRFDQGYSALNEQDKGAYVEVIQTVSGTTLDSFVIKNINTEKIIANAKTDGVTTTESNGWMNYTIYVNGCDFASSTIQIRLGLGYTGEDEKCTGYAFFDDVTVTKYRSLESEGCSYNQHKNDLVNTSCNLTSDEEEKVFIADKELRANVDNRNQYDFYYAIDLASEIGENVYKSVSFTADNVKAGLTTDKTDDKTYATSLTNEATVSGIGSKTESGLSLVKGNDGRPTSNDLLGAFAYNHTFTASQFKGVDYSKLLNEGLTGEGALPDAKGNMLVMLSAWGAAYTSTLTNDSFTLNQDEYLLVSLWVKTSDMDGKAAATIKVYDVNNEDNAQTLSLETTNLKTNFEDEKDIYNGWAQCFVFVKNGLKTPQEFKIDFCFGNTAISSATLYKGGWAALADMQTLAIDEDVYNLAAAGDRTAVFSFSEDKKDDSGFEFDSETGISDIKKEISNLSNYDGLNGSNSLVSNNENRPYFDTSNTNKLAGLINRDYAESYETWQTIYTSFGAASANWDDVFGKDCYQPLIIINNLRYYADKADATETTYSNYYVLVENERDYASSDIITANGKHYAQATEWNEETTYYSISDIVNYGFVSNSKTISANGYETISVKVKVSEGAVAYIYLVDANNTRNLLSYSTPVYSFNYDEEGNVLDAPYDSEWKETEHRSHIVYTLRDDGLYEAKGSEDNKLYANLYNLTKSYKNYKFEHDTFYDKEGNAVSFDDLVDGEEYYPSATDRSKYADHYLVAKNGTRVYEYIDGTYYYLEYDKNDKAYKTTVAVENFDKDLANYKSWNEDLFVKVENTNGEWLTVNFFIHTGSESKNYRLELWSGSRTETGVENFNAAKPGAVAFDYSAYSVTSSNYSTLINEYSGNIIAAYQELLGDELANVTSNNESISYYEELTASLIEEGKLNQADVDAKLGAFGYEAKYYTYNLYDSAAYVPFNANTASEGDTGYDYKAADYSETLAYLTCKDEEQNSYNVFADYSAVDQSISMNSSNDTDDGDEDEETETNFGDLMLYIASIILVVVLLITLISLLVRKLIKVLRKNNSAKTNSKNAYRQRDRYIKKLRIVKEEVEEVPATETTPDEAPEEETENAPEEEAPAEETVEVTEDAPAETTEETPDEEATQTADEVPAEETPAESDEGDKPEEK